MTPNDDTASFVVDEDAASAAENSSIVTRSSSAREVVSLADITFSGNDLLSVLCENVYSKYRVTLVVVDLRFC